MDNSLYYTRRTQQSDESKLLWLYRVPVMLIICENFILRGLLLPTSSTASYQAVSGLRLVGHTRLRRCEFRDRLPQHCSCWCTKDSHGPVAACVERGCARSHQHSEVWPPPGSDTARTTSLTFPIGCSSSWQWQFTGVWMAALHCTCRTTVSRPPVLTLGDSCVPATVNFLQYLVTGSILMVATPFQLPAPRSGSLSRILCGTRDHQRRLFQTFALKVLCRLLRYINLYLPTYLFFTYLLTYFIIIVILIITARRICIDQW